MARPWQSHVLIAFPMDFTLLWIPATLAAAAAQTARNATQRQLTERIGTVGATQVRFLYGFPFALLFIGLTRIILGETIPGPNGSFVTFLGLGATAQILATALMLAAMRERSFSVVTAIIKMEPAQTAAFGLALLGDPLTPGVAVAIGTATLGVVLMSIKPGAGLASPGVRPVIFGLLAGSFFALAAIGFRGAILALDQGSFLIRATTTLVWGLGAQTLLLLIWLSLFDRASLLGSLRVWRPSLGAGFLGALASQFWFVGFSLTTAANVRTLAVVEVLMAQAVSRRVFSQATNRREVVGMVLIVVGVMLLLRSEA